MGCNNPRYACCCNADDDWHTVGCNTARGRATTVEVLEPFTFADGAVRLALVTWAIGNGERRAVSVREAVAS